MHRSRHLAAKVFSSPIDRILQRTTYTSNLADNIEATLKSFCGTSSPGSRWFISMPGLSSCCDRTESKEKLPVPTRSRIAGSKAISAGEGREFDPSGLRGVREGT